MRSTLSLSLRLASGVLAVNAWVACKVAIGVCESQRRVKFRGGRDCFEICVGASDARARHVARDTDGV